MEPRGEVGKARFVDDVLDQVCVGDDEAEPAGQALALSRDEEQLAVLLVEEHGRLGAGLGEPQQPPDE
ncbi:MAG: hypothetical protein M3312_00370 [Actinomycetota bacterium]|nr:hypothetical protein [Actinomycetota bacterium]